MRTKRKHVKCTVCGKVGHPTDPEDYVCQSCQKEWGKPVDDAANRAAIERIQEQTKAANERPPPGRREQRVEIAGPAVPKKLLRRSISVKGVTDQRLDMYAKKLGKSKARIVEDLIHEHLDAVGAPMPKVVELPPGRRPRPRDYNFPLML